jgi:hypothetical protein
LKAAVVKDAPDSQIMNAVVRMVVPMRREFGRQLDVAQFMLDKSYARSVLEEALTSQDARLLEYARYISARLHGARIASAPPAAAASAPGDKTAIQAAPAADAHSAEDEMRARVTRKYTSGLR